MNYSSSEKIASIYGLAMEKTAATQFHDPLEAVHPLALSLSRVKRLGFDLEGAAGRVGSGKAPSSGHRYRGMKAMAEGLQRSHRRGARHLREGGKATGNLKKFLTGNK